MKKITSSCTVNQKFVTAEKMMMLSRRCYGWLASSHVVSYKTLLLFLLIFSSYPNLKAHDDDCEDMHLSANNNGPLTCAKSTVTLQANNCYYTSGTTYTWTGPGGFVSYLQCPTTTVVGCYTVVAKNDGCTKTRTTTVESDFDTHGVSCTSFGVLTCSNRIVILKADLCLETHKDYLWSGPSSFTSAAQCPTVDVAGDYTVVATNPYTGCTSSCVATVEEYTMAPVLTCTNSGPLTCSDWLASIRANDCEHNGNIYTWTGPDGFFSLLSCNLVTVPGDYTVCAKNIFTGCTNTCVTTVEQHTMAPVLTCTNSGPITCTNKTVSIRANDCEYNGNSYVWTGPGGFSSTHPCTLVTVPGDYTVCARNASTGCTNSCVTTVGQNTATPHLGCETSGSLTCSTRTVSLRANYCSGTGIDYLWSGPSSFTSAAQCPTVGAAGFYTVIATNTLTGCTNSCVACVIQNTLAPVLTCTNSGPILCAGRSVSLSANHCYGSGVTYTWTGPSSFSVAAQCPTTTVAGNYTVVATKAVNGCTNTCNTTVSQNTLSLSILLANARCFGGVGNATVTIQGGTPPYNILWSTSATTSVVSLGQGTFSVTITDAAGCARTATLQIGLESCRGFKTVTMGGWGTKCSGGNPGCYRDANFAGAFPSGVVIGACGRIIKLTTSTAVKNFLPASGTPSALATGTLTNPHSIKNTLAGQVTALTLNVGFDNYDPNFSSSSTHLGDLIITSGTFMGWTVNELLAEANKALGNCSSYSASQINDAVSNINENYDNGGNKGFLACPCENGARLAAPGRGISSTSTPEIHMSAYPNPFEHSTIIEFSSETDGTATVNVYSIDGKQIASLYEGEVKSKEVHKAIFNGENLPAGIYFYKITIGGVVYFDKLILSK